MAELPFELLRNRVLVVRDRKAVGVISLLVSVVEVEVPSSNQGSINISGYLLAAMKNVKFLVRVPFRDEMDASDAKRSTPRRTTNGNSSSANLRNDKINAVKVIGEATRKDKEDTSSSSVIAKTAVANNVR